MENPPFVDLDAIFFSIRWFQADISEMENIGIVSTNGVFSHCLISANGECRLRTFLLQMEGGRLALLAWTASYLLAQWCPAPQSLTAPSPQAAPSPRCWYARGDVAFGSAHGGGAAYF